MPGHTASPPQQVDRTQPIAPTSPASVIAAPNSTIAFTRKLEPVATCNMRTPDPACRDLCLAGNGQRLFSASFGPISLACARQSARMPREDAPLSIEIPKPEADRPAWGRVGIVAAAGFVIGILWPRLTNTRIAPNPPADNVAASQ